MRRRRTDIAEAYEALKVEVSERRALQDELTRQALHDPLTGLANRALLVRSIESALEDSERAGISVVLIDLDGFKEVNDRYGHAAGDHLLQSVARRLRGCVRTGDVAARLGGDEFALLLTGGDRAGDAAVVSRVVDSLHRPISFMDRTVRVGASAGISYVPRHEPAGPHELLRDADIAMYVAKANGKGHFEIFEPAMRIRSTERAELQQDLARAIELDQVEVHYQPIVDLETGRVTVLEALARWQHPSRGLVSPMVFIPVAEDTGAIVDIGRHVLVQACCDVQDWRAEMHDHHDLGVTVNISVRQITSGQLVEHVQEALNTSDLPATALTLEVTESSLLEMSDTVRIELGRLRALGVKIAVDDFGAGYSSLGFLLSLDADVLKIDRTLLNYDTAQNGSLVKAVAELGRTLGLTVVVEGVETEASLALARDAHCDAAQGFLFSRPQPATSMRASLLEVGTTVEPVAG